FNQRFALQRGRLTGCYVGIAQVIAVMFFLVANSAHASNVFKIDTQRIHEIAMEAAYLDNEDLKPGDLELENNIVMVICSEGQCSAIVDFKIRPTIVRTTRQEEDGRCWEELRYEKVDVRVFGDGSYKVGRSGTGGGGSTIGCELLEPPT
ncbi:MAG: hypothetical protein JJ952_15815, partial [Pseudomonadales bacterium]|nr:hypothetical protein [Pseudomonadales bacterium]